MRDMDYYRDTALDYKDAFNKFTKKTVKEMDVYDVGAVKCFCLVMGAIIGSAFPKITKKYRTVGFVSAIIVLIPTIIKTIGIFKSVFKRYKL